MNLLLLIATIILLLGSNLLLRSTIRTYNLLSPCLLIIATILLTLIYGVVAGVFIAIASFLLTGLLTALCLGKAQ